MKIDCQIIKTNIFIKKQMVAFVLRQYFCKGNLKRV